MSICELLSPAGGPDTLIASVKSGADSVYLGGELFNARQSAVNFDNEKLSWAVDYCHLRGVKVFVTVNTLINDREFDKMKEYLVFLNNIGVDAIIVQDLGVAYIAKQIVPDLPLHASTQMTVTDVSGALLLQEFGFKRVVLARELSYEEIEKICKCTDIEIEIFVHGAICVCYSGQCLMSSFIGGRSGNRGACAQPCRLSYSIDKKDGFLLSPKDMGLIKHLNKLKKIGVNSLKIEGRMKGEDYVKTVVSLYRKYLDNGENITKTDYDILEGVFYRGGLTDGYFTEKLNNMICHNKPDNPYKKQIEFLFADNERKREIEFEVVVSTNKPVVLKAFSNGISVEIVGTVTAETAVNAPITKQRIIEQLSKLGSTVYKVSNIKVFVDDNVRIPISELNNLRRQVVEKLNTSITKAYKRTCISKNVMQITTKFVEKFDISVMVSNAEQAQEFSDVKRLYVPIDIYNGHGIAVLPRIDNGDIIRLVDEKGCKEVLVRNLGQLYSLKDRGVRIYADFTLNAFNSNAVQFLSENNVSGVTLSTELMLSQIRDIKSNIPLESIIYGYIPLMITKNCLIRQAVGCKNHKGAMLKDRTDTLFKIKCLSDCKNEIYNSLPIVMSDKMNDVKNSGVSYGRLMFADESPDECRKIYEHYKNGDKININFTRGKFYKGV